VEETAEPDGAEAEGRGGLGDDAPEAKEGVHLPLETHELRLDAGGGKCVCTGGSGQEVAFAVLCVRIAGGRQRGVRVDQQLAGGGDGLRLGSEADCSGEGATRTITGDAGTVGVGPKLPAVVDSPPKRRDAVHISGGERVLRGPPVSRRHHHHPRLAAEGATDGIVAVQIAEDVAAAVEVHHTPEGDPDGAVERLVLAHLEVRLGAPHRVVCCPLNCGAGGNKLRPRGESIPDVRWRSGRRGRPEGPSLLQYPHHGPGGRVIKLRILLGSGLNETCMAPSFWLRKMISNRV